MPNEPRFIPFNSAQGREAAAVYELAKNIRAPFIEQAISIERMIDEIISQHFCPDEVLRRQFFSIILGGTRIAFSEKIDILEVMLRLSYFDLYQRHKTLKEELSKIRRFRNLLVHSLLDTSDKFIEKKHRDRIQLVYYQDGRTKQHVVTVADVDARLRACSAVVIALAELLTKISRQTPQ